MNNQTKSQTKATIHQKEEKTKTKMLWLLWKLYHNWVVHRRTQNHWNLKEAQSLGATRCRKTWNQFKGYDSHSLRYVKQVSGKLKDHRVEKYKSKSLISEVPTLRNWRTDLRKRLKDKSDAPEARHGILPKTYYKLKEKDKATFYSPSEEWVLLVTSTIITSAKRVCCTFRSKHAHGQQQRP